MNQLNFGAEDPFDVVGIEYPSLIEPVSDEYVEMEPEQFPEYLGFLDGAESFYTSPDIFSEYELYNLTTGVPWDEWLNDWLSTVGNVPAVQPQKNYSGIILLLCALGVYVALK